MTPFRVLGQCSARAVGLEAGSRVHAIGGAKFWRIASSRPVLQSKNKNNPGGNGGQAQGASSRGRGRRLVRREQAAARARRAKRILSARKRACKRACKHACKHACKRAWTWK